MAGKGRTGTAVAILNTLISIQHQIEMHDFNSDSSSSAASRPETLKQNVQLSIWSIVRRLREQRPKCIQTQQQYQFIYAFIQRWFDVKICGKELKVSIE